MDVGDTPATTASTEGRRVRENAPLQNGFSERDRTRRPRIERERFDGQVRRRQKNFRRVILATHQLLRHGRDALHHRRRDRAQVFAARKMRCRFLFCRCRMHRALARFRNRISRRRAQTESAVIRKTNPGRDRQEDRRAPAHRLYCRLGSHASCSLIRQRSSTEFLFVRSRRAHMPLTERCCEILYGRSARRPRENSAAGADAAMGGALALL